MDTWSGSYPAKKHRLSVRSGYKTRQDIAVQVFRRVSTRTEPNRRPKPRPLAGYLDPLLTLSVLLSSESTSPPSPVLPSKSTFLLLVHPPPTNSPLRPECCLSPPSALLSSGGEKNEISLPWPFV